MPWHTGKPAADDFLSVSVQHIRENFAELEPLHSHVAELVDLTALHPHVAELVDLTALQPHVAEFLNLTTLEPHIAVILSSRIIDHNLDVPNPPNGYYVRWENGLQACWHENDTVLPTSNHPDTNNPTRASNVVTFVFPAAYVSLPRVSPAHRDAQGTHTWPSNAFDVSGTECKIRTYGLNSAQGAYIGYIAIGRWK